MPRHLSPVERERIATDAARRYAAGESWREIAADLGLSAAHVRRLTTARHEIATRRWGSSPAADAEAVADLRAQGHSIPQIAQRLGVSQTAVRTALEAQRGVPRTRYPRLSAARAATPSEVRDLLALYDSCPPAARAGHRLTSGDEGRMLAEAVRSIVDDGVPMDRLSRALGRGPTWVVTLLSRHDLRPDLHEGRSTRRRTRKG